MIREFLGLLVRLSEELLGFLLKGPLLAALFLLSAAAHANEDIQRRFWEAMQRIDRTPAAAVEILEGLTADTDALRIRLELGRALYLDGRLKESKAVFTAVLKELTDDAPPQVRTNVERFLIDINRRLNPFRFGFSVVKDTNPTQSTETRKVEMFGLEFDYTPEAVPREAYGLRLNVEFFTKPTEDMEVSAYLGQTQYETSQHRRALFVPEIRYLFSPAQNFWGRIGIEHEELNRKTLRNSKFIGFRKLDAFADQRVSTMLDTRWVFHSYPDYGFVNGKTRELQASVHYRLTPVLTLNGNLSNEKSTAKEAAYASTTRSVGYGVVLADLFWGVDIGLNQKHRRRKFEGDDPFFGFRRHDRDRTQSITMQKSGFYIWGIVPSIEIIRERRDSNIKIVEFDRTQTVLTGVKLF